MCRFSQHFSIYRKMSHRKAEDQMLTKNTEITQDAQDDIIKMTVQMAREARHKSKYYG
jgi:hypothetical protein